MKSALVAIAAMVAVMAPAAGADAAHPERGVVIGMGYVGHTLLFHGHTTGLPRAVRVEMLRSSGVRKPLHHVKTVALRRDGSFRILVGQRPSPNVDCIRFLVRAPHGRVLAASRRRCTFTTSPVA